MSIPDIDIGTDTDTDILFAGRVARREAFDRNCDGRVASMRWTRGPPDQERRTWLNKSLSDSSQPSITRIITAEITSNRWTSRDITTAGSKSNGRSEPKRLFINASRPLIRDRTIIRRRRRFVNRRAIAIVDQDESIRSNGWAHGTWYRENTVIRYRIGTGSIQYHTRSPL